MGADIHAHIEIKWDGEWLYYSPVNISRNYELFARMAHMGRCKNIDPVADNRGIPEDATKMTLIHNERWGVDGHSHSWLTIEELCILFDEFKVIWPPFMNRELTFLDEFPGIYLFENSFSGFLKYPEERPEKLEDVRIIFWFDN
jgi:hypothetical protein